MRILHDLGVAVTRFSFFMDSSPQRSLELDGILWQQYRPDHTEFPPTLWEWNAEGVKGTAARMEQLCVHALLVQLYAQHLVSEGEIPPVPGAKGFGGGGRSAHGSSDDGVKAPVWLGKNYQLQRQTAGSVGTTNGGWQRGLWRALSPLVGPVAAPMEWVEPVLVR